MMVDSLEVIQSGRQAAEEILKHYFRIPLGKKKMDLSNPEGFDQAVMALATKLQKAARSTDTNAVRIALESLDVDWHKTTMLQRNQLISRAIGAIAKDTKKIGETLSPIFILAASEVVSATRHDVRQIYQLRISPSFNVLDKRITQHLVRSQSNFVKDEYGRRLTDFGARSRQVVADGLESGLGRADIASDLERAAELALVRKNSFYWETLAGAFVSSGRTFGQMSSFAEAGIQRYAIEAVLDERTTRICQYLHGKQFEVGDALKRFEQVERLETSEAIKSFQPWVREYVDRDRGNRVLYVNRNKQKVRIVESIGSGSSSHQFERGRSERDLMDLGVSFPPFHGLCRSVAIPIT